MIALAADRERRQAGPVFLWCHETWRQPYETGIQRVVRRLGDSLAKNGLEVVLVGWDWRTRRVKALGLKSNVGEQALNDAWRRRDQPSWLLVAELGLELAAADLDAAQIGHAQGLKVAALVHDLIPLKRVADYDGEFLACFRRYVRTFAAADLVLASTHHVANELVAHTSRAGLPIPRLAIVPLPGQFAYRQRIRSAKPARAAGSPLHLLTVSTWEPRKNLPRLLRAIRQAETRSASSITLTIVGRRGQFADYDAEVEGIIADMPRVTVRGSVSDDDLFALYASSHASVYPSVEEGFGLPVGESLWLAKPCVCHRFSSLSEVAPGGGTLMIDMTDEAAIAGALLELLDDPDLLARLSAEAVGRPLASWSDYAHDIACNILPDSSSVAHLPAATPHVAVV